MSTAMLYTYSSLRADIAARAEELAVKGFDEEPHPRDEHGRFSSGAAGADKVPDYPPTAVHILIKGNEDKNYDRLAKHMKQQSLFPSDANTSEEFQTKDGYYVRYNNPPSSLLQFVESHPDKFDLVDERPTNAKALKSAHKFSTVQLNLPAAIAQQVRTLGRQIPDADLADDGREQTPHVTVKFGLDTDSPADLLRLLSNQPPVRLRLGKLSVFDAAETGAAFDVLTVEVNSPDLERLNSVIVDALPTTQTHNFYHPHATICYLQPGKGAEYVGLDNTLEGISIMAQELTFSNQDGEQTTIPLEGEGAMSKQADDELYKSLQTGITLRLAELKGGPGSGPHKKDGGDGTVTEHHAIGGTYQSGRMQIKLDAREKKIASVVSKLGYKLKGKDDLMGGIHFQSKNGNSLEIIDHGDSVSWLHLDTKGEELGSGSGLSSLSQHIQTHKSLKAEFNEEEHPRGEGGKFSAGGAASEGDKKDAESNGHAWKEVNAALTEHLTPQEKTAVVSGLHQKLQTNEGPRTYQKQDIEKILTRVGVGEKRREQVLSKLKSLKAEWSEEAHPRGEGGKFSHGVFRQDTWGDKKELHPVTQHADKKDALEHARRLNKVGKGPSFGPRDPQATRYKYVVKELE